MSYDDLKSSCIGSWKEKYNYLEMKSLEDKNGEKDRVCSESNNDYKLFNPQTDHFQSFYCFDVDLL